MVLLKHFLAAAALLATAVIADEPTTDAEAADFWNQLSTIAVRDVPSVEAPIEERAPVEDIIEERGDDNRHRPHPRPPPRADPYKGRYCPRKLDVDLPKKVFCNRNNCFRSFLSTNGHERHCPSEAFGFCCLWLSAGKHGKQWALKNDYIFKKAPYTKECRDRRDNTWDIIKKIDDVCGCTVDHKVTVEVKSEYFSLRNKKIGEPICRKKHGRWN